MSISPETRISRIPRLAMAGAAVLSMMAYKPDFKHSPTTITKPEMTIPIDPRLLSYTVDLSSRLVQTYVEAHSVHEAQLISEHSPAEVAASEVTQLEFKDWSKVNVCEEGGNWHAGAPDYDGLGESAANWIKDGGEQFAPNGYQATPDEQIVMAERIQKDPPDQDGTCVPW